MDPSAPLDHNIIAPYSEVEFARMGVTEAWRRYADRLSFGRGQVLAILDDGCDIDTPEWRAELAWGPKVVGTWNSIDGTADPRPVPPGYHGTTVGYPSSLNYQGRRGVAFNNQVVQIRSNTIVHLRQDESATIARALAWVVEHRERFHITTVNLAAVDDQAHDRPMASAIDEPLKRLRQLGVWVSAPCANNQYTTGISWPACAPDCFAIGAVMPDRDEVHLDRCTLTDIVVPAKATSSSNAFIVGCAMILREAIERSGYRWQDQAENLPRAMMRLFQETGVPVADPATGLIFPRLDLLAALQRVMGS